MDIELNVISEFKVDTNTQEFIDFFNYKLLKIILHLENQGSGE